MNKQIIFLAEIFRLGKFLFAIFCHEFFKTRPPVIVYQMGKVASSSIIETLKKEKIFVFQVHRARLNNILELRERTDKKGLRRRVEQPGRYLGSKWSKGILKDLPIIVLFREPLKRNISAFYQNRDYYFNHLEVGDHLQIVEEFMSNYNHDQPLDWLNSELLYFFPEVIQNNDITNSEITNICLLLSEFDDDLKLAKINALLKTSIQELSLANTSAQKYYNNSYRAVSSNIFNSKEVVRWYKEKYINTPFQSYYENIK